MASSLVTFLYSFVPTELIQSAQVNANFSAVNTWIGSQPGLTLSAASTGYASITGSFPNQVLTVGPYQSNSYATWIAAVKAIGTCAHAWPLNDTTGTTATDVIGTSNGTYVGSPTLGAACLRQTGVGLSGTGQYVSLPAIELPTTAPWSVECYAAFTSSTNNTPLYAFSGDAVGFSATFATGSAYTALKNYGGANADPLLTVTQPYLNGLGGQGGQFDVDSSGDCIFVSYNSNVPQLVKYSPNGTQTVLAATLPAAPTGAVALDSSGNIYVGANSGTSIWKYSSTGTLLSTITISGMTHGPGAMTINQSTGEIWVIDGGGAGVASVALRKFAAAGGAPTVSITTTTAANVQICLDSAGNIYAGLSTTSIAKYPAAGGAATLTITGLGTNVFGIAIDGSGNIWIGGEDYIVEYSSSGTLLNSYTTTTYINGFYGYNQDAAYNNYLFNAGGPTIAKYGPVPNLVTLSLSNTATAAPIHYVSTYDGTTLRFYVNGVMVASSLATIATSPGVNAAIGSYNYPLGTTPWQGVIANVAIYATALTGAQISSLYNAL